MNMKNFYIVLIFNFLSLLLNAQVGSLDSDFDGDGKVIYQIVNEGVDNADAVLTLPNSKILIGGHSSVGGTTSMNIICLNQDGSLDQTFNNLGYNSAYFTYNSEGKDIAVQPDGKIVMVGWVDYTANGGDYDFAIARFNENGTLDNTFSTDGKITIDFGANDKAYAVTVQPDGKILIAGEGYTGSNIGFAVVRLNTDGTLDNTFSSDGKLTTVLDANNDNIARGIAVCPDGSIVVVGDISDFTGAAAIAKYLPNGNLDVSFNSNGKLIDDLVQDKSAYTDVKVLADGKIVVCGGAYIQTDSDIIVARYNTDGTRDNTFSSNGWTSLHLMNETAVGLDIQSDGRYVIAAYYINDVNVSDYLVARFNDDGSIDNSFGNSGYSTVSFGSDADYPTDIAIASPSNNPKLVVAGITYNGSVSRVGVAQFISNLNVGIAEFSTIDNTLIYPNPLQNVERLKYTLVDNERISISLIDSQGKLVAEFVKNENRAKGEHEEILNLPPTLPSGTYFIQIASTKGNISIKAIK